MKISAKLFFFLLFTFLSGNAFSNDQCTDIEIKVLDEASVKLKKKFFNTYGIGECHNIQIFKENSDTEFCIANVKLDEDETAAKNPSFKFVDCTKLESDSNK